jgi:hypothetical protein
VGIQDRRELNVGALAALAALLTFAPRIAREMVLIGDSSELVGAAVEWGIPHPPGYPLWTALAHLASLVPIGSQALRVNATSALFHALTVGFVAAATLRLTRSLPAAVAAGAALCLSGSFFLSSLYAEVFPLNNLAFAALLYLSLRFFDEKTPSRRSLGVAAIVLGLGLAHHQMLVLALPALAILAYPPLRHVLDKRTTFQLVGYAVVAFAICQVPLFFLARRDPSVSYGEIHDLSSWFLVLTRSDYGGLVSATRGPASSTFGGRMGAFAMLTWQSLGILTLAFAALGLLALSRDHKRQCLALAVAVLVSGPLFASINAVSVEGEASLASYERFTTMFLPPFAILVGSAVPVIAEYFPERARAWAPVWLGLVAGLAGLPRALKIDLGAPQLSSAFADDLLAAVPDGALVLITGDTHTSALQYRCATSDACRRYTIVAPGQLFLPWRDRQTRRRYPDLALPEGTMRLNRTHELVAREIGRRPVYIVPALIARDAVLAGQYNFAPEGLLLRVFPDAASAQQHRRQFLELSRAILAGERCGGCQPPDALPHRATPDSRLLAEYGLALRNMARRAMALDDRALGNALFARARELEQVEKRR